MKQASEPIHSVHHMTLIRTMLWVVTTFSCGVAVAQSNVPPTLALGNQITSLATLLSDGYSEEFTEARTYHSVDLFGHGRKDAVVFFTLEGEGSTVYYGFYMAVFENVEIVNPGPADAPRYRLIAFTKIGGKGWRHIDFSRIDYSKLRLKVLTKEYANRDPMCCPSKNAYVIYKLQDGGLREMTPKGGIKGDARR